MNKIEELIQQYCPNGVEFKKLWEVTAWDKKFNGLDKHMQKKIIIYPYVLANKFKELELEKGNVRLLSTGNYIGWTTEELAGKHLCEGEIVAIPWGGKANVKYCKGKFVTADNRIATSLDTNILMNKFLYYWMLINNDLIESFYRGSGIKHPSMKSVLTMEIPIPPLPIQQEIVKILDSFTQLEAELEAELEARRAQYEYYRNRLLSATELNGKWLMNGVEVEWKSINDVCTKVTSGGTPLTSNSDYYNGDIPWLRTQEVDWCDIYDTLIKITEDGLNSSSAKLIPANCVIVAMYGATAAKVAINKIPLSTNQACCNLEIDESISNYRYVFHWLSKEYSTLRALGEGSQSNINSQKIKKFKIPIPPLAEQERIVEILDKFDALVNDISIGLPAEIDGRRKQYNYYRGKLLDFKPVVSDKRLVVNENPLNTNH